MKNTPTMENTCIEFLPTKLRAKFVLHRKYTTETEDEDELTL